MDAIHHRSDSKSWNIRRHFQETQRLFVENDQNFELSLNFISVELTPIAFEGGKISVSKMLSSHFQVSHTMTLSNGPNNGYKFGANYAGTQLYSASEVRFELWSFFCIEEFSFYLRTFRCSPLYSVMLMLMEIVTLKWFTNGMIDSGRVLSRRFV